MSRDTIDNILAFATGDLLATAMLYVAEPTFFEAAEKAGLKLLIILCSGFFGGMAGMLGKHVAQKYLIDRYLKLVLVLPLLWVVAGCKATKQSTVSVQRTQATDSTLVMIEERLVPVYVPGDTVTLVQQVECPDGQLPMPVQAASHSRRAKGSVQLSGNTITATLTCAAWIDSVKARDVLIARLQATARTDSTVVTVPVRFVPHAYKVSMWFSCGVVAALVIYLMAIVARAYFKLKIPFI